jgi:hypothetical protein
MVTVVPATVLVVVLVVVVVIVSMMMGGVAVILPPVVPMMMAIVMGMPVVVRTSTRIAFGLEGQFVLGHDEVHAFEPMPEPRVGFDQQPLRIELHRRVPPAQMVGRAQQVARRAMLGARTHDQHGLGCSLHADERAVFGHQHIAAAQHGARLEPDGEFATGRIPGLEAGHLPLLPTELDARATLDERRGKAATLGHEFVHEHRG